MELLKETLLAAAVYLGVTFLLIFVVKKLNGDKYLNKVREVVPEVIKKNTFLKYVILTPIAVGVITLSTYLGVQPIIYYAITATIIVLGVYVLSSGEKEEEVVESHSGADSSKGIEEE